MPNIVNSTEFRSGRNRGVIAEAARLLDVSPSAVRQGYFYFKNPRVIEVVDRLKEERRKASEHDTKLNEHTTQLNHI